VLDDEAVYSWGTDAQILKPKPSSTEPAHLAPNADNANDTVARSNQDAEFDNITLVHSPNTHTPIDIPLPTNDSLDALNRLRRIRAWHNKIEGNMFARVGVLAESNTAKELQCKRLVSICTSTPLDKVDQILETLITSLESEAASPETARITTFMQRANGGATMVV